MSERSTHEVIDTGAHVFTADGHKVGSVSYVVVHPHDLKMTDVVVSTGSLLGRDIVVPVGDVARVEDDGVHLSITREKLDGYPNYVDVEFEQPPIDWAPAAGMYWPSESILWPSGAYGMQPTSVKVNAPTGTVGLHEGMEVVSSDGHRVGSIHALDADETSDTVTGFVVKQGVLLTHDVTIPADRIDRIESDRVVLNISRDDSLLHPPK